MTMVNTSVSIKRNEAYSILNAWVLWKRILRKDLLFMSFYILKIQFSSCVSVEGHLYTKYKRKKSATLVCKMLGLYSSIYNIANKYCFIWKLILFLKLGWFYYQLKLCVFFSPFFTSENNLSNVESNWKPTLLLQFCKRIKTIL